MKPDQTIPASIVPIHLLLVEDNPGDARLVQEMLRDQPNIILENVACLAACLARLERSGIDLVLLDLGLCDSQGLDTITTVAKKHPKLPVVAITGLDDDVLALRTVQAGGQDYLTKNTLTPEILRRTVHHAIERKRMESQKEAALEALRESEGIFSQFLAASPVLVYVKNEKHAFSKLSKSFENVFGKPTSELIGKDLYDLLPPELAKIVAEDDRKVLKKGISVTAEERLNGRVFSSIKFPIHRESGKPDYLGGFSVDITERKQAEENLKKSLAEKEVLLKEVHHRVKNNLMTIIGLIKMQEIKAGNEKFKPLLQELEGRIRSIAMVHESLHKSENLARIDLQNYIEAMSSHTRAQFGAERDIRFSVQAAGVMVDLDIAVSCGLILNELITNAYKHAFPGDKHCSGAGKCEIAVSVKHEGGMLTLTVADNGVGLPAVLDWEKSEALGLRLIKMLSKQLNGSIELDRSAGTVFRFKFPMAFIASG